MAGFFNFIKDNPPAKDNQAQGKNGAATQSTQQPVQTSQQVVQGGGQQSYNGIGATPGGGEPYNGIGAPPAAQQPPVQAQPIQTVQPAQSTQQQPASNQQSDDAQGQQAVDEQSETAASPDPQTDAQSTADSATQGDGASDKDALDPDKTAEQSDATAQGGEAKADGSTGEETEGQATDQPTNPAAKKQVSMDLMTHLTQRSNRVFLSANHKASELKVAEIDSEHLLHGLLADAEIYKLLTGMKIQPQTVEQELEKVYKKGDKPVEKPQMSPRVKRIIENSLSIARKLGYEFISPEHLLLASYEEGEGVAARVLQKLGLDRDELQKKILGKKAAKDKKDGKEDKKKSALQEFTIDLTQQAKDGKLDPVVGRSQEIERVIHILSRRLKNNPVLTGEPGVGKTAIVEGLAQKIVNKQVPESLLNKRILQLDLMSVVAGASHRGEFEQRMKDLVEEVTDGKGQVILFIDEIHNIMGAGGAGDGASDASNFLKPALSRGQIQLIGATTITEYKIIEKDAALERRFQAVTVPEPDEENAIKMLKALRNKFEAYHRVKIPDNAIEASVKLSKRYIGERFLPDKAVDLIDEASSAVRLPMISLPEEIKNREERVAQLTQERDEADQHGDKVRARILNSKLDDLQAELNEKKDEYNLKKSQTTSSVTVNMVKDIVAKRTGIPVSKVSGSEKEKLSSLEDIMHERMIGQERAVTAVSQAVRRGRAGLKANNRPIGSFVFLGPTGVGKTELAKTLADTLFGQEDAMIRFDMTEYMEKHEVAKLLGPPPGYVGYEEGGKLTEAVRRRQYAVVLFDEVEKAHPDIFNIMLQILDDGRLTDNKGRTISFKNTVVICTSNIGSKMITEALMKGAGNKGEAEEPPALTTFTFSPRGREIMTIGTKVFERSGSSQPPAAQEKPEDQKNKDQQAAKGDQKSKDKNATDDSAKKSGSWDQKMLFDYFAGQKIERNQDILEDDSDEPAEFPTLGYDTHAISPKGVEMITRDSTLFMRTSTTSKVWETKTLIDYFSEGVVINALPDAPDEQLPTAKLRTHTFTPSEEEVVTYRDRFWKRKTGSNDWQTGLLKEYFLDSTAKDGSLPVTHWDIHTFSPTGREMIIVGESIWFRDSADAKEWTMQSLHEYFGTDLPLESELEEKEKIENESEGKMYTVIKEKVMGELLKFFRPELVNRFDEVIVFEPLKFGHMIEIVKLQLKALAKQLEDQEMGIHFTDAAMKEIVRSGFDPVFGARPLRRAIQKLVENPISEMIIGQQVKAGDMIYVDSDGEQLVFDVERTEFIQKQKTQKQNYTPLNVEAFLGLFYSDQKDAIMAELVKVFPSYAEDTKGTSNQSQDQSDANDLQSDTADADAPDASEDLKKDDSSEKNAAQQTEGDGKKNGKQNGKPNGTNIGKGLAMGVGQPPAPNQAGTQETSGGQAMAAA